MTSLRNFVAGAVLDIAMALTQHTNGSPGFYMATVKSDAEYFAIRKIGGGNVLTLEIEAGVLQELRALGAVQRAIPGIPPPYFLGDEIYLPEKLFVTFNTRLNEGGIRVHL